MTAGIGRRDVLRTGAAGAAAFVALPATAAVPSELRRFVTRHVLRTAAQAIEYRVEAADLLLRDEAGRPSATLFGFSYLREQVATSARPITFLFGGGPGGSAMSWHLQAMGPRTVAADPALADGYHMVDNSGTILDVTDMVFIDPVSTGFSRVLPGMPERHYWGLHEDANAIADYIRAWLVEHDRVGCPVHIAGVSYGTVRAATLSHRLQALGTPVSGVILNSSVIDYASTRFESGSDLAYVYFLPSYAAAHWYHALRGQGISLDQHLARTEAFALDSYGPALAWGDRLAPAARAAITRELTSLTGLPSAYLEPRALRVESEAFMTEYGKRIGSMLSRSDGRVGGAGVAGQVAGYRDAPPFLETPMGRVIGRHMREELGIVIADPYINLALIGGVNWNTEDGTQRQPFDDVDMAVALAEDMRANPRLRVMMAAGWYDLSTPYFASQMVLSSHGLPQERLVKHLYASGHGVHRDPDALALFQQDMRAFVTGR